MALYAISYDEVDALADFTRAHDVTFPLLSDPDSEIIERFGILNTIIDPDDHPWYGIPFPGAYVLDADGTIVTKFFESSLQFRPSADQLLRAALGDDIHLPPMPAARGESVGYDVIFDGDLLRAGVLHDLVVRFAVPEGQHLYGEPVPDGMVATTVEIEPDLGLVVRPAIFPPTVPHTLAGTGETLRIFDGDVVIRIPVTQLSRSLTPLDDGSFVQRIGGTVRWQACDDDTCHLPRSDHFSIDVPAAPHHRPEAELVDPNGMDMPAHLTKMVARRTDKSLGQVLFEITGHDA